MDSPAGLAVPGILVMLGTVITACGTTDVTGPSDLEMRTWRATMTGDVSGSWRGTLVYGPTPPGLFDSRWNETEGVAHKFILFGEEVTGGPADGDFIGILAESQALSGQFPVVSDDPPVGGFWLIMEVRDWNGGWLEVRFDSGHVSFEPAEGGGTLGTVEASGTGFPFPSGDERPSVQVLLEFRL